MCTRKTKLSHQDGFNSIFAIKQKFVPFPVVVLQNGEFFLLWHNNFNDEIRLNKKIGLICS
jgi:hypothetical protein